MTDNANIHFLVGYLKFFIIKSTIAINVGLHPQILCFLVVESMTMPG